MIERGVRSGESSGGGGESDYHLLPFQAFNDFERPRVVEEGVRVITTPYAYGKTLRLPSKVVENPLDRMTEW